MISMADSSSLTLRDEPEPTHPFPPRYWWLARITTAILLLGFALGGTWFAWDREARRRLE